MMELLCLGGSTGTGAAHEGGGTLSPQQWWGDGTPASVLAGRKSISGKPVTHRALTDLGVGLTGNVVESPGKQKKKKKPLAWVWL